MLMRLIFNVAELHGTKYCKILPQRRCFHSFSNKKNYNFEAQRFIKPKSWILNSTRDKQSASKVGGKGVFVVVVPLSLLGLAIWAFVFEGFSLKRVAKEDPLPLAEADEIIYVSKVEKLAKERRERLRAAANQAKNNDHTDLQ